MALFCGLTLRNNHWISVLCCLDDIVVWVHIKRHSLSQYIVLLMTLSCGPTLRDSHWISVLCSLDDIIVWAHIKRQSLSQYLVLPMTLSCGPTYSGPTYSHWISILCSLDDIVMWVRDTHWASVSYCASVSSQPFCVSLSTTHPTIGQ